MAAAFVILGIVAYMFIGVVVTEVIWDLNPDWFKNRPSDTKPDPMAAALTTVFWPLGALYAVAHVTARAITRLVRRERRDTRREARRDG